MAALLFGTVISLNYRVAVAVRHSLAYRRQEAIVSFLARARRDQGRLQDQVTVLRRQLARPVPAIIAPTSEIERLRGAAGFAPLRGAGIRLTLGDSEAPLEPGEDPNLLLLHDSDLLRLVNDLRVAGANGIALSGERLLATSEIRCAGPTISVNGRRIAVPVEIAAVGNPGRLEAGLQRSGGILGYLAQLDFYYRLRRVTELTLPAYDEPSAEEPIPSGPAG